MLNNNRVGRGVCYREEGGMMSGWAGSRIQSPEGFPDALLFFTTTRYPPPPPAPSFPFRSLRPAGGSLSQRVLPKLLISELVSPARLLPAPALFLLHNLILTRSPAEPGSSLGCLPTEPSRFVPPLGLSPGPRRSDWGDTPSGPGATTHLTNFSPWDGARTLHRNRKPSDCPTFCRRYRHRGLHAAVLQHVTGEGRAFPSRSCSSHRPRRRSARAVEPWSCPEQVPANSTKSITARLMLPKAEIGRLAAFLEWRIGAPKSSYAKTKSEPRRSLSGWKSTPGKSRHD